MDDTDTNKLTSKIYSWNVGIAALSIYVLDISKCLAADKKTWKLRIKEDPEDSSLKPQTDIPIEVVHFANQLLRYK